MVDVDGEVLSMGNQVRETKYQPQHICVNSQFFAQKSVEVSEEVSENVKLIQHQTLSQNEFCPM